MVVAPDEMEARLRAFYAMVNPGNEQNIAEIVRKYRGKEAALCARLQKKYGKAPDLVSESTPTMDTKANPVKAVSAYDPHYEVFKAVECEESPLDFRSSAFDALKALTTASVKPLVSSVYPLDNIHKCRHLLPESDPNHQRLVTVTPKPVAPKPSTKTQAAASTDTPPPADGFFSALADTYLDGPFTVLRRCFLERKRVQVVIRRVNSIRGTCSGFLKAFDKHMNLVLLDVTEVVIPFDVQLRREAARRDPTSQSTEPLFSVADPARNHRFITQNYAKQLFVRGDNVVMVMEERRPAPTSKERKAEKLHEKSQRKAWSKGIYQ
ncbi:hypothetical protein Poli38472_010222 [Pythium oligandrum]|uniref:Sm domain-containing protein n=1 Tax=Pythium oligandrum TaxID=41045 RepID=A0A8K1FHD1_PYTOL|nr:hypothetical protein Poli38472_010222 [Pythium oligandrum]|eukprot:TMW58663.1 hypothetical protein Poli38472_010222 [Pythium oligandrum]